MTLPFGVWDVGQSFNEAVDLEEEENEQYEDEINTVSITVVPETIRYIFYMKQQGIYFI